MRGYIYEVMVAGIPLWRLLTKGVDLEVLKRADVRHITATVEILNEL